MSEKKEDDEFVLQIAYTFHKLLMFEATKQELLTNTSVVFYLVDLLQDTNKEVQKTASKALDVVQDTSEEWAVKLRAIKFEVCDAAAPCGLCDSLDLLRSSSYRGLLDDDLTAPC